MRLPIGERIRDYRRQYQMTQQQLAEALGVSYQSVSRWENEEGYPDMELLPALAEIFQTSADSLLGIREFEREKQAHEVFDALRRESIKKDYDPGKIIDCLREIRRNYINTAEAWRPWVEGNGRCFRDPEILPEVRLTAEAYLEKHRMDPHVLQTMSLIEDEEHLEPFLDKYTTPFDTSRRALLFRRYFRRQDGEKLEPERRYRLYDVVSSLLSSDLLCGLHTDERTMHAMTDFQIRFLELICGDFWSGAPDIWTCGRLDIGMRYAEMLAKAEKKAEAMEKLCSLVSLLEAVMKITEKIELPTACSWLEGMLWNAEESWGSRGNDPDSDEERAIFIYTTMSGMMTCDMVYPSDYYKTLLRIAEHFPSAPEYSDLLDRVKKLIETRSPGK